MTLDRTIGLLTALVPFLTVVATVLVALITRPHKTPQTVATGITVDDHSDEAIDALRESRDVYRDLAKQHERTIRDQEITIREWRAWGRRHPDPQDPYPGQE